MPSLDDLRNLTSTPSNATLVPFLEQCIFRISDGDYDLKYGSEFSRVFNAFTSSRCEEFSPGGSSPPRSLLDLFFFDYKTIQQVLSKLASSNISRSNRLFLAFLARLSIEIYGRFILSLPVTNTILLDIEHAQVADIRDVYVSEFRLFSH